MGSLSQCKCPQTSMHFSFPSLQAGYKVVPICWWDQKPTLVKGLTENTGICTCHWSSASQSDQSCCRLGGLSSSAHAVLKHELGTKVVFLPTPPRDLFLSARSDHVTCATHSGWWLLSFKMCGSVWSDSVPFFHLADADGWNKQTLVRISPWAAWRRLKTCESFRATWLWLYHWGHLITFLHWLNNVKGEHSPLSRERHSRTVVLLWIYGKVALTYYLAKLAGWYLLGENERVRTLPYFLAFGLSLSICGKL